MSRNYDGSPEPAGNVGTPTDATPGAGHTNNAKGLGERRSINSLSRHFSWINGKSSRVISEDFWTSFIEETKARYAQAPDLSLVNLRHPMHPNTHLPGSIVDAEGNIEWDDLNAVSPGDSLEESVVLTPCVNWPLPGPTARKIGPVGEQNPKYAAVNESRINYVFMEARRGRYAEG